MNTVKISKGTIIRTIALAVVLLNMALKAIGKPLIEYDEGTVMFWLEYVIEVAVILTAFWKNNSFSKVAIKADKVMNDLKEAEYAEWEFEDNCIEEDLESEEEANE